MTKTTTLSSRERVQRMMEGVAHDRVPRHDTFWPDTIERWQGEGLDGDEATVLSLLETDFHGLGWNGPCVFRHDEKVREDEQTEVIRDRNGVLIRRWKSRSGTPEHLEYGCKTRRDWDEHYKPALLRNVHRFGCVDVAATTRAAAVGQQYDRWLYFAGMDPFECTRALIGDETTMIAMAEDPEWVAEMATTYVDLILTGYRQLLDAGVRPDGIWTYGDMAYNHSTMCSPAMYRELMWPQHKRLCDLAHANGMKFIYHSDGDVNGVLDLYVDAGFDCLQPLEAKANMDVRQLAPSLGDQLGFMGNIDVMTMSTNDPAIIEAEIRDKFAVAKRFSRYAYHSDHSVPPAVSWETYRHIIEFVDRYGWYD